MDTSKKHGPSHLFKNSTKHFIKKNYYKNRNNYKDNELQDELYINRAKWENLLWQTHQPAYTKHGKVEKGNYRDMLLITFITIPKKLKRRIFLF